MPGRRVVTGAPTLGARRLVPKTWNELDAPTVQALLKAGADPGKVAERLVASGAWTEDGATEIVHMLTKNSSSEAAGKRSVSR